MRRTFLLCALTFCIVAAASFAVAEQLIDDRAKAVEILKKHDVKDIVFAVRGVAGDGHWYANISYNVKSPGSKLYRDNARLVRLNIKSGETTDLLHDEKGGVRDPQVHYDGKKILFSYRRGGQPFYNLFEINVDGSGLKQITSDPYDDIEPTYLPCGDIVFCSTRAKRVVQCWFTRVATIHRCKPDGSDIHELSCNIEHDNTPWPLPDGRLLYMRWEYIDRSRVQFHHLWTMNADGTGQMVYFGNMHPGNVMIDAKPIPGTQKVVACFSPGHGRKEHAGRITIVDPSNGPDDQSMAKSISGNAMFRDPYPLSENAFIVADNEALAVLDAEGKAYKFFDMPKEWKQSGAWLHEPRPIRPRPRERITPTLTNRSFATGMVTLENVYIGRNMEGVEHGDIKKLLILEALPKPVNFSGTQEPISRGGTFTLVRILGTVPVDDDGSASMILPAMRSLFFVALDENNLSVKRMQSFMSVQPGERLSCVGCHEERGKTPLRVRRPSAMLRAPDRITPIEGVPEIIDFPRDIQPILDKHCVVCHGTEKTERGGPLAGGVLLDGGRERIYTHSYSTLNNLRQFVDGRDAQGNKPPRAIGSSASLIVAKFAGEHNDVEATPEEQRMVRLWVEVGAPYPGTLAALGTGMLGRVECHGTLGQILNKRCADCHIKNGAPGGRINMDKVVNLSDPNKSLALLMPLAAGAGGIKMLSKEKDEQGNRKPVVVFEDKNDPDYKALLESIEKSAAELNKIKRFDMPGFRPNVHYLREMQVYGILSKDFDLQKDQVDPYELDQQYWQSLWHEPIVE